MNRKLTKKYQKECIEKFYRWQDKDAPEYIEQVANKISQVSIKGFHFHQSDDEVFRNSIHVAGRKVAISPPHIFHNHWLVTTFDVLDGDDGKEAISNIIADNKQHAFRLAYNFILSDKHFN